MSAVTMNGASNGVPYLTGYPTMTKSRKKPRRDKPFRKFHIPCLEKEQPNLQIARPPVNPIPYVPQPISDFFRHPPGTGKAAKKARRRARKRRARALAKVEAEEAAREAAKEDQADLAEIEEQKKKMWAERYLEIKAESAKAQVENNLIKTRAASKRAGEKRAAEKKVKTDASSKKSGKSADDKSSKKRKAEDEGKATPNKKSRNDDYVPSFGEDGYEEALAQAKAGKEKAVAGSDTLNAPTKRKRDGETSIFGSIDITSASKKRKLLTPKVRSLLNKEDTTVINDESDSDDDTSSTTSDTPSLTKDALNAMPNPRNGPTYVADWPDEILENLMECCDPPTRTMLGLTNKHFGRLALKAGAGFPTIRDRYGSDIERHHFMTLLDNWMNRTYTDTPEPTTLIEQTTREAKRDLRLCYICRKYLPICGKKLQYWKDCPKKDAMPNDPASAAAHATAVAKRQERIDRGRVAGDPLAFVRNPARALPKVEKQKPKPQEFEWKDEDWTIMMVGACKSRVGARDVKSICPRCTLSIHTVHLGWPSETPIVRWFEKGEPMGGRMAVGHMPLVEARLQGVDGGHGELDEGEDGEEEYEPELDEDEVVYG